MPEIRVNHTVRVMAGKYAGLAGEVVAVAGIMAKVHFSGIFNGEPIDKVVALPVKNLEVTL